MATCDVSVVCCRRFPVDCAIVVLAEELKNRLFLWSFHCFEDIFTFFVCFLPFTWLTKADFHYIQVDAFLAGFSCRLSAAMTYTNLFQPFFIKTAAGRHCDVQVNPRNNYRNAHSRPQSHSAYFVTDQEDQETTGSGDENEKRQKTRPNQTCAVHLWLNVHALE